MCGQTGIIFGMRERTANERLKAYACFAALMIANERRGPHATGIAILGADGEHKIIKDAVPASEFMFLGDAMKELRNNAMEATAVFGHTRWTTRGAESVSSNNHPIRSGKIVGTHNGTIYNADKLFEEYGFHRHAEVDSELIFRCADKVSPNGRIRMKSLLKLLAPCEGQATAIMASTGSASEVVVLKGRKPLSAMYNKHIDALVYSSCGDDLEDVMPADWKRVSLKPMSAFIFHRSRLYKPDLFRFNFKARSKRIAATRPIPTWTPPSSGIDHRTRLIDPKALNNHTEVFVYGTLLEGEANHEHYCKDVLSIDEATVIGALYRGPGFPFLSIPQDNIIAEGSLALRSDVLKLCHYGDLDEGPRVHKGWQEVSGQVITFRDGTEALAALDKLEGFGGSEEFNLYDRVLTSVWLPRQRKYIKAWVYVMTDTPDESQRIESGDWRVDTWARQSKKNVILSGREWDRQDAIRQQYDPTDQLNVGI